MRSFVKSKFNFSIDQAVLIWFVALGIHFFENLVADMLPAMLKVHRLDFLSSRTGQLNEITVG